MAYRKILESGEKLLKKVSRPVEKFDERLFVLLDDMRETLKIHNGVGLAAPQVGVLRRAVIIDWDSGEPGQSGEMIELINPEIVAVEGEQTGPEGCLSFPGVYGYVMRPQKATVRAQNRFGKWLEYTGEDLMARCICHEVDHLDGRLFSEFVTEYITHEDLSADEAEESEGEEI